MRLAALVATIALAAGVGAAIAANPSGKPTCPSKINGATTYTLSGQAVYDETGGAGVVFSISCDYTPSPTSGLAGGSIAVYWVAAGHTVDPKNAPIYGCGKTDDANLYIPSSSYWAYGKFSGGLYTDSAGGKAGARAALATVGSFAEPCKASGSGGVGKKKPGTSLPQCPHKKPVTKVSDTVAETVAFMATHSQSGSAEALNVTGGAHLKSSYCFYSDGTLDRVGSASGNGQILQASTPPLGVAFSLTGFPKSAVHGKVVTDTYTGKVTAIQRGSLCKVGATVTIVVVKTPTASRVSFSISGGCGSHAFAAGESSVSLKSG